MPRVKVRQANYAAGRWIARCDDCNWFAAANGPGAEQTVTRKADRHICKPRDPRLNRPGHKRF